MTLQDSGASPAAPGGIQKRLSWNYGQHIPNNDLQLKSGGGSRSVNDFFIELILILAT